MARLALLLCVASLALVAPCQASFLDQLFGAAKKTLLDDGTTVIVDHVCNYRIMPRLRSFELYFRGDVWCPGWTTIKGESLTRSRTRVVTKAVADFAKKALDQGLITQEEANPLFE